MPDDQNNNNGQATGEDTNKNGAGAGEGHNEGGDQNKDTNNATDTGGEDAGKGEGDKGGEGDNSSKKDNAKAPDKDTPDEDDNKEPEVRKRLSTKDFIIGRQRAKIAKKEAKADDTGDKDDKDEDEGEDGDVAPEDEELINKVVAKNFAPILDKTISASDNEEIVEFLKENPDFKPFEAKARRFIAHPSRRHLPIKTIFYEVAGDKLMQIGAKRQQEADKKAKDTQTGGGSNRASEGTKSVWDLTPEEFEAEKQRVREANRL